MRLIDADALIEALNNSGVQFDAEINRIILEQPTAYDVDKVVEEVKEALRRLFNFCEEIDLHLPEDERTGYHMLDDIWAIRDIVEEGGINKE